jgi:hypothetical protein
MLGAAPNAHRRRRPTPKKSAGLSRAQKAALVSHQKESKNVTERSGREGREEEIQAGSRLRIYLSRSGAKG